MKTSLKILLPILILGAILTFLQLFHGHGGEEFDNFVNGLTYTSIIIELVSLILLLVHIKRLKENLEILIFVFIGLPFTVQFCYDKINKSYENRTPDLTPKYYRPIDQNQFQIDSLNADKALDSLVSMKNRLHNSQITDAFIDTIIYSPKGDKILVVYIMNFDLSDLASSSFLADEKDSISWNFETSNVADITYCSDISSLKLEIRKSLFNHYVFADKDSLKDNYFWKVYFTKRNEK